MMTSILPFQSVPSGSPHNIVVPRTLPSGTQIGQQIKPSFYLTFAFWNYFQFSEQDRPNPRIGNIFITDFGFGEILSNGVFCLFLLSFFIDAQVIPSCDNEEPRLSTGL